jgi:hypothetical protein
VVLFDCKEGRKASVIYLLVAARNLLCVCVQGSLVACLLVWLAMTAALQFCVCLPFLGSRTGKVKWFLAPEHVTFARWLIILQVSSSPTQYFRYTNSTV